MEDSTAPQVGPVTAGDVARAVALSLAAMRSADQPDWSARAGAPEWSCWETVEHMSDDLFAYGAQLGPKDPPLTDPVPFATQARRPGGPECAFYADLEAGPEGLMQVFEASGALLVAMLATCPAYPNPPRPFGVADPAGFAAAVSVAEVLLHTYDVAQGIKVQWVPPAALCARVLARLFPDAPPDSDPWAALLWATGRGEVEGREHVTSWQWHIGPRD
jgi:hypothetical protein